MCEKSFHSYLTITQGQRYKNGEETEAESREGDCKEYQLQTIAQMEKVKQLEEELAKEQSRLQAMISHLKVESMEKMQNNSHKTDMFSQSTSNSRNFVGNSFPSLMTTPLYHCNA